MSLQNASESLPVRSSKRTAAHPFAPLSRDEISTASSLIQSQWPEKADLQFKAVTLEEPAKAEAVPFLEAERNGQRLPAIDRKAFVNYYIRKTVCACLREYRDMVLTRRIEQIPRGRRQPFHPNRRAQRSTG